MKNNVIYFVEGKCEVTSLRALKENPQKILPGQIREFNLIQQVIPNSILMMIRPSTKVVFVFDTDVPLTLPTAKAGGFLVRRSRPASRTYTISPSV